MDRHTRDNGFTLLEMCITVCIMTVLTLCTLHFVKPVVNPFFTMPDDCLYTQSEAILSTSPRTSTDGIYYNGNGNVNLARTMDVGGHTVIVELGGGRLVFR